MSQKVREWLRLLALFDQTTHEDRQEIDREIEQRKGVDCDKAIEQGLISKEEFIQIVHAILNRKKKHPVEIIV